MLEKEAFDSGVVVINDLGLPVVFKMLDEWFRMAVNFETRCQNNENYMANVDLENVTELSEYKNRNVVPFDKNGGDAA